MSLKPSELEQYLRCPSCQLLAGALRGSGDVTIGIIIRLVVVSPMHLTPVGLPCLGLCSMKLGHGVSGETLVGGCQHPVKFLQAYFWGLLQRSFCRGPTWEKDGPQSGKDTETTNSKTPSPAPIPGAGLARLTWQLGRAMSRVKCSDRY